MELSCHSSGDDPKMDATSNSDPCDPTPGMALPASHLELHLQQDLEHLRSRVMQLGTMAARALSRATEALHSLDQIEAQALILRDRLIDQEEGDIERLGLELLVRHQPAGRHLRFLFASLRIVRELERIGDCAESIARQTLALAHSDPRPELPHYRDQAIIASEMLQRCLQAFGTEDDALARQLIPMEDAADQLREQIIADLLARQQTGALSVHSLTTLLTLARRFERITDNAKRICEEIVFLVTGHPARHPHAQCYRVLFVDDCQAGLGHLAERVARRHVGDGFEIHGAGLHPAPPHPATRAFLQAKGFDVAALVSRSLGQVPAPEEFHLIIALTEGARIIFPMSTSRCLCLAWPMLEPTTLQDSEAVARGLETAWCSLEQRLAPLLSAIQHD